MELDPAPEPAFRLSSLSALHVRLGGRLVLGYARIKTSACSPPQTLPLPIRHRVVRHSFRVCCLWGAVVGRRGHCASG